MKLGMYHYWNSIRCDEILRRFHKSFDIHSSEIKSSSRKNCGFIATGISLGLGGSASTSGACSTPKSSSTAGIFSSAAFEDTASESNTCLDLLVAPSVVWLVRLTEEAILATTGIGFVILGSVAGF